MSAQVLPMSELDLGLPPPRERRPFYSGVAMSTNAVQDYGTPIELFTAICRKMEGLPPDGGEQSRGPWVDPFASAWNALVPRYYSLPGGGGIAEDGLRQTWKPPPGTPRYVVFNPVYEDSENPCATRCKKKRCMERGFCLLEYKPGMPDALIKAEHEALSHGMECVGILPARQAEWFQRTIAPPPEVAGALLASECRAFPGAASPWHGYLRTVDTQVYRYQRLEVEVVRLAQRQRFRTPPGALTAEGLPVKMDSAGFDSMLVVWRGLASR